MQAHDCDQLLEALHLAGRHGELLTGVAAIHAGADAAVAARGMICMGGGACCRFDLAGHRLFATTGELALLLGRRPAQVPPLPPLRCPYQLGPRCMARDVRPLGCRTFFCNGGGDLLQIHERSHACLRSLHDNLRIPYLYVEATAAIAAYLDAGDRLACGKGKKGRRRHKIKGNSTLDCL